MLIFLDTETTSVKPDNKLVQLAYREENSEIVDELFKPAEKIEFGAMAVHHITTEMVMDKETFVGSNHHQKLQNILNGNILVAHNASFDIRVLENEGIKTDKYIDTLNVARHLIKNSESHSLQYLRYSLNLKVEAKAHDAKGDIIVLEKLFEYLMDLLNENMNKSSKINKMLELTITPVLLKKFQFGKYNGKTFEEVSLINRDYLSWLYKSEMQKAETERNAQLVFTLACHLKN